jgi:suppressor of tumorigenicity protein 13
MSQKIPAEFIQQAQQFVNLLKTKPDILHAPEMKFFRDYIESLGGKIPQPEPHVHGANCNHSHEHKKPEAQEHRKPEPKQPEKQEPVEEVVEEEEEKPEPDDEIWEADAEPSQEMGVEAGEVSDEDNSAAMDLFSAGRSALQQRSFEEAIAKLTEAIKKAPSKAVFFATRAEVFLKLKKPNAAIKDADRALTLNPNQAKAYKVRGKARRHLGQYEEASLDLNSGQKIDFDDDTQDVLNSIKARVEKIVSRKREQERKKAERELNERKKRVAAAQKAAQERREQEEREREQEDDEDYDDMPGMESMPNMGGMPGGMGGMPGMADAFKDPEVMAMLQDPEVMKILTDNNLRNQVMACIQNPSAFAHDAKITALAKKVGPLFAKFGSAAGKGPGGMGGMGGFPGGGMGGGGAPSFDDDVD